MLPGNNPENLQAVWVIKYILVMQVTVPDMVDYERDPRFPSFTDSTAPGQFLPYGRLPQWTWVVEYRQLLCIGLILPTVVVSRPHRSSTIDERAPRSKELHVSSARNLVVQIIFSSALNHHGALPFVARDLNRLVRQQRCGERKQARSWGSCEVE